MKPRAFWFLALFAGLITAAVLAAAYGLVYWIDTEPTQAYLEHQAAVSRHDDWYAQRHLYPNQLRFDEVLAGRRPLESLDVPNARLLAEKVRTLAFGGGDAVSRVKMLGSLFIDGGGIGTRSWVACRGDRYGWKDLNSCEMQHEVASLGNPERLVILLGNDEAAKNVALPAVPDEFQRYPAWYSGPTTHRPLLDHLEAMSPFPRWSLAWFSVSTIFTGLFFLRGYVLHRRGGKKVEDTWDKFYPEFPNPYNSVPHFPLGWIVYLGMLPGVLVMHVLRFVTSDAQPTLKRAVNALRRRTFDSEHERTLTRLSALRSRAVAHEHSEGIVKMIDQAIARVNEVKNLEELDVFRKVAGDIESAYEAQLDLRETLST